MSHTWLRSFQFIINQNGSLIKVAIWTEIRNLSGNSLWACSRIFKIAPAPRETSLFVGCQHCLYGWIPAERTVVLGGLLKETIGFWSICVNDGLVDYVNTDDKFANHGDFRLISSMNMVFLIFYVWQFTFDLLKNSDLCTKNTLKVYKRQWKQEHFPILIVNFNIITGFFLWVLSYLQLKKRLRFRGGLNTSF